MKTRDYSIDFMKGCLVFLMIASHLLYATVNYSGIISEGVNLVAFSGFLFCFGYVSFKAYFEKYDKVPAKKLICGAGRILLVYYICMIIYLLLFEDLSPSLIISYLCLQKLSIYSEFLVSWVYLFILILIGYAVVKKILNRVILVFAVCLISLITTFVPYEAISSPYLGPLIGCGHNLYFPIVQYLSYFIVGAYISKNNIKLNGIILGICLLGNFIFIRSVEAEGCFPVRWGVSLAFITGGYLYVYLLYLLSGIVANYRRIGFVEYMGKHTLSFLLISNICVYIFLKLDFASGLTGSLSRLIVAGIGISVTFGLCFMITYIYQKIYARLVHR